MSQSSQPSRPSRFEHAFHRTAERHERIWIFLIVLMLILMLVGTLFYVVRDYGIVAKGASFNSNPTRPANLAEFQSGRVGQTGPDAYSVYVIGHVWNWTPDPIRVPADAAITFHVTSTDVLHGFEVQDTPINLTAVPGIVGTVTYTFHTPGTYHVICNEFCGIEHQGMIGRIIVTPRKTS